MSTQQQMPIHPAELLRRACDAYLVDERDVLSRSRLKDAREARQLLYLLLYEQCGWPVTLIGHKLHRDHSTVCHGIARARKRIATPEGSLLYARMMGTPAAPKRHPSGGAMVAREAVRGCEDVQLPRGPMADAVQAAQARHLCAWCKR